MSKIVSKICCQKLPLSQHFPHLHHFSFCRTISFVTFPTFLVCFEMLHYKNNHHYTLTQMIIWIYYRHLVWKQSFSRILKESKLYCLIDCGDCNDDSVIFFFIGFLFLFHSKVSSNFSQNIDSILKVSSPCLISVFKFFFSGSLF